MSFSYPQATSLAQKAGLATGGRAHSDEKEDRALVKKMVKKPALTGKRDGGMIDEGTRPQGGREAHAKGGKAEHWIAGAIKHPGALHKELGVPEGKKIPAKKLKKAEHSKNPTERKRAQLAETLKGMNREHHAKGGKAGKTNVNIIIAQPGGGDQPPMPMAGPPMPPPGAGAPPPMPQKPPQQAMPVPYPVPMGGAGGPPPMPPGGPMPRKRGGRTHMKMEFGAGSGDGRIEKANAYGKKARELDGHY